MATKQALREQNQLLKKQLEDMSAQMQALMAQLQVNTTAQSSQVSQEAPPQNVEQMVFPPAPATVQIKSAPARANLSYIHEYSTGSYCWTGTR